MRALVVVVALACAAPGGWTKSAESDGVVVYNRVRPGARVKEVLAVGTFDAPPAKVHAVLDDLGHYKDFMPYTEESKELRKDERGAVTYERIHAPLSDARDYTILVHCTVDDKGVVTHTFTLHNELGPKPKDGVVRIETLEGHWLLEPVDGGKKTRASYWVYTDPGGSIPAFVANMANNTAVPGLYAAVRKRLATAP